MGAHSPCGSTDEEWFTAGPLDEGQHELKLLLESEDAASYGWDETGHSQEWTIRVPKDNLKLTQLQ